MKKILTILAMLFCVTKSDAATVTFTLTNYFSSPFTNSGVRVFPISTPILVNGSYTVIGLPIRLTLNTNGVATTNLAAGNYQLTNTSPAINILFAVPASTNTYAYESLAISGGNVFNYTPGVSSITGTNGIVTTPSNGKGDVVIDGASFAPTSAQITNALGFFPLSPTQTTNAITNAVLTLSNNVFSAIAATNTATRAAIVATNTALLASLTTQSNNLVGAIVATNTALLSSQATLSNNVWSAAATLSNNVYGAATTLSNNAWAADATLLLRITTNGTTSSNVFQTIAATTTLSNNFLTAIQATNTATQVQIATNAANILLVSNRVTAVSNALTASIVGKVSNTNGIATNLSLYGTTALAGTILVSNATGLRILQLDDSGVLEEGTVTVAEVNTLSGISAVAIQTQLNNKLDTTNGIVTNGFTVKGDFLATSNGIIRSNFFVGGKIMATNLTASRALVSDASKNITNSTVTTTELGYVSGVTSALQTQINSRVANSNGIATNLSLYGTTTLAGTTAISNAVGLHILQLDDSGVIEEGTVTVAEVNTLSGISAVAVQTQLNNKLDTTNGIATNSFTIKGAFTVISNATVNSNLFVGGAITATNLTASRLLVSDGSKGITNGLASTTEANYLVGVTGGIQTNIIARLPAVAPIATNSLQVKGTFSVNSNSTFNTLVTTNGATNFTSSSTYGTNFLSTLFFGDLAPATNGSRGSIYFHGLNSDSVSRSYASLETTIDTHTAGSENGRFEIKLLQGGLTNVAAKFNSNSATFNTNVVINGGLQLPNASAVAGYVLTATGTNGQTAFAVPLASTIITSNVLYVAKNGSDSTGTSNRLDLPFLTIGKAKTNAHAGDLIYVYPGIYNENDLAKDGVRYYFSSGADVVYDGAAGTPTDAIFDDHDTAMEFYVDGAGSFTNTQLAGAFAGILSSSNAGTVFTFKARNVSTTSESADNSSMPFRLVDGTGTIEFEHGYCSGGDFAPVIYWVNGEWNIKGNLDAGVSGIWSDGDSSASGNLYYDGENNITGIYSMYSSTDSANNDQRLWVTGHQNSGLLASSGGREYFTHQKVKGLDFSGGSAWVTVQKVSVGDISYLPLSGGTNHFLIQDWEDTGSLQLRISGGKQIIDGGTLTTTNLGAVVFSGGTAVLKDMTIDSSATSTNPVFVGASGLTLKNCTIVSSNTIAGVTATNAQTVTVDGILTMNELPSGPSLRLNGQVHITAASGSPVNIANCGAGSTCQQASATNFWFKKSNLGTNDWIPQ